ncbi:AEC family transporter [Paucilactobacillus suebicus]|uniref:Malate transport protein n=1 Tax=Paucilactobacillus suebicus DSM 5007 = KCTC 3549 TaxID=1423807 RepID=A0A0R1W719_9LACO|nr:AEC family transporter [Paucilactobacillus suebicus]KRM11433.1 malate transport protein [Paucilactobacillus suebicus DSM 5007 = KCTC 3549]
MNISILLIQIGIMAALIITGILIKRQGSLSALTSSDLTNILLYVVSPCLIIKSFEMKFSPSYLTELGLIGFSLIIFYVIEIIVSWLIFSHTSSGKTAKVLAFASIYSNAGFMGIPLVQSLLGSTGVFYASISLAIYNIFNWTHGVSMFHHANDRRESLISLVKNPNIWAVVVGLVIFMNNIQLPSPINQFLTDISYLNTPLAMFVVGANLASVRLNHQYLGGNLWLSILLRNVLFPVIMIILLRLFSVSSTGALTTVLMAACPTASLVVLFSVQYHSDTKQAIPLFGISTLLCLVTLPLIYVFT